MKNGDCIMKIMTKLITLVLMICFFVGCEGKQGERGLIGPTGSQGEQGEDGKSLEIIDINGVLVAGNMITEGDLNYWDIELPDFPGTFFISVVVSTGSEYSWNPFTWGYAYYNDKCYARIYYEVNWVEAGFEYCISIAY